MAKAKKLTKARAKKYDPKLAINGSFADVIGVSVGKPAPEKKDAPKPEEPNQ